MKEKMRQFMTGRYGTDQLGRFTMGIGVAALILHMLTKSTLFYILTLFCLIAYCFRAFSRDFSRRYNENLQFLRMRNQFTGRLQLMKLHASQSKDFRFYKCPSCQQKVRVPRGRGKIAITCPKCRHEFVRKS